MTAASVAARSYISKLADSHPNAVVRAEYAKERDFYEKKLWHQLTLNLETLVTNSYFDNNTELLEVYDNFIREFEGRINQLKFVKIGLSITRQVKDPAQAVAFIKHFSSKLNKKEKEAYSLTLSEMAQLQLRQNQVEPAKALIDEATDLLDDVTGADTVVNSSLHKALSSYYKVKVAPTEFYRSSLTYLVYTPVEMLSVEEQRVLAFDMGIAALVSPDVYNFGQLLSHPILQSLAGTNKEWLGKFLYAFNSGDLSAYEHIMREYHGNFDSQAPALKTSAILLREKISMLALMELVFNRTAEERTLNFKTVADATKVSLEEVELLVMKALSLNLIRGIIDEPNGTVSISWVQPRILDLKQVEKMKDRVAEWEKTVTNTLHFLQNETAPELLA